MGKRTAKVGFHHASDGVHIILTASNGAALGPIGEAYDDERNARRGWAAIQRAAANCVDVGRVELG